MKSPESSWNFPDKLEKCLLATQARANMHTLTNIEGNITLSEGLVEFYSWELKKYTVEEVESWENFYFNDHLSLIRYLTENLSSNEMQDFFFLLIMRNLLNLQARCEYDENHSDIQKIIDEYRSNFKNSLLTESKYKKLQKSSGIQPDVLKNDSESSHISALNQQEISFWKNLYSFQIQYLASPLSKMMKKEIGCIQSTLISIHFGFSSGIPLFG